MSKRVTIMIDDDNDTKIRKLQADKIRVTNSSVSFSSMVNDILRQGLKK